MHAPTTGVRRTASLDTGEVDPSDALLAAAWPVGRAIRRDVARCLLPLVGMYGGPNAETSSRLDTARSLARAHRPRRLSSWGIWVCGSMSALVAPCICARARQTLARNRTSATACPFIRRRTPAPLCRVEARPDLENSLLRVSLKLVVETRWASRRAAEAASRSTSRSR
jgi:hypothetical protein